MDSGASSLPRPGSAGEVESMTVPECTVATEAVDASGCAGESQTKDDFTSVEFTDSDDGLSTKDQATQTISPHMVNEMTQYRDPDDFGSGTDTDASTDSSLQPIIFSAIGARRRRLRASDWLMPDQPPTEGSIQYTGNGHAGERDAGPEQNARNNPSQ